MSPVVDMTDGLVILAVGRIFFRIQEIEIFLLY